MDTKMWKAVLDKNGENIWPLTESGLRELVDDFLATSDSSQLLSMLCEILVNFPSEFTALYRTTIVMKFLCRCDPRIFSTLSQEQKKIIGASKTHVFIDSYGRDQGICVRRNVNQILNYVTTAEKSRADNHGEIHIHWDSAKKSYSIANDLHQILDSIRSINSESVLSRLRAGISSYNEYLPGPTTPEKYGGSDETLKVDGITYGKLVESVVDAFDENWPFKNHNLDPPVERLIVVDGATFPMFHENLIVLTDALKKSTNRTVTNTIVHLLEKIIKSEALFSAITDVCKLDEDSTMKREESERMWQKTIQILVSLPSRVANKLDGKVPDTFLPDTYAKILVVHIGRAMLFLNYVSGKIHSKPRVNMLSSLISKAVVVHGSHRFEDLIDIMSEWCSSKVAEKLDCVKESLSNIDRPAIQPIAVSFLKRSESMLGIREILSDLLTNVHWKNVFTVKIPLMSYYDNENLIRNLIACLSMSRIDPRILLDLLMRLLDIWGDRSALNHTSLEQHEYITKLIILSIAEMRENLSAEEKNTARRLLFAGTSAHLESTQAEIRGIGMITGEIVLEMLNDTEDAPKLKYDYDGMPEGARKIVENLRNLGVWKNRSKLPTEIGRNLIEESHQVFSTSGTGKVYELAVKCGIVADTKIAGGDLIPIDNDKIRAEMNVSIGNINKRESVDLVDPQNEDEILDSDDDLVPYDMSNDTPISEKLRPTYLRDLKENLLNSQSTADPNIFAESMKFSEELILSQLPNDDASFALELLEILVSLRENSYCENFELFKFKACVAVTIVYPRESAKYLCDKFHTKMSEYSINDRLFMLDVLSESARKLSKIEMKPTMNENKLQVARKERKITSGKRISLTLDSSSSKKHETLYDDDFEVSPAETGSSDDWEEIVSRRIQSNTRRFAHPSRSPTTTMNRFNDVAASFFYPLLYGFRRDGTCMRDTPKSFEDQENILLVHYLKALSTIMIAAENCTIVPKMAKEILDLAWSLRYHNQAKVRLCIIENTASVVITLPKEGLTAEIMELIYEFRAWLSDVSEDAIRGDPDSSCRSLGRNVVALIDSIFHSTLNEL